MIPTPIGATVFRFSPLIDPVYNIIYHHQIRPWIVTIAMFPMNVFCYTIIFFIVALPATEIRSYRITFRSFHVSIKIWYKRYLEPLYLRLSANLVGNCCYSLHSITMTYFFVVKIKRGKYNPLFSFPWIILFYHLFLPEIRFLYHRYLSILVGLGYFCGDSLVL